MGQVYLGQVEKGLSMLSVALLLIMKVVLGPLGLVLLIFNVLDAFFWPGKSNEVNRCGSGNSFFTRDRSSAVRNACDLRCRYDRTATYSNSDR